MKKIAIFNFCVFSFIGILFISCVESETEDMCTYTEVGGIISVTGSSIGEVNETINLEVKFGVGNGCGQFNKFIEPDFVGNEKIIKVETIYIGCICTHDAPIRTVNYEFETSTNGVYNLKFKKSLGGYIIHEITIN